MFVRLGLPGATFPRLLIERRNLIGQLVRRDFEQRYVGSVGGWLWTLVHPIVQLLVWVFVFQIYMRVPPPAEAAGKSYVVYLFCAFLPWMLFSETLSRSANCLLEYATLITKTIFPSEILPVTLFLSALIGNTVALALALASVLFTTHTIGAAVITLPLYTALVALLGIGLGWIFSALQVYLRDTSQFVQVLLQIWFWATPIFLDEARCPMWARRILEWNPLTAVVHGYRRALLLNQWPNWNELAYSAVLCTVVFVAGGLFYRQLKRGFADVL